MLGRQLRIDPAFEIAACPCRLNIETWRTMNSAAVVLVHLPRCPWCRKAAKIWRERTGGGWIAGCANVAHAAGPAGCAIQPYTLPMTTRAAAVREWKKGFTGQ